jgi:hypothetical protein
MGVPLSSTGISSFETLSGLLSQSADVLADPGMWDVLSPSMPISSHTRAISAPRKFSVDVELDSRFAVAKATKLSLCTCSSTWQDCSSFAQCLRASRTDNVSAMP